MLSNATKYKLYLWLKSIADCEALVEDQRQQVGLCEDFEPWAAFKRIEAGGQDRE